MRLAALLPLVLRHQNPAPKQLFHSDCILLFFNNFVQHRKDESPI
jgi:hypothetical protein